MKPQLPTENKFFKMLIPLTVVLGVIYIIKSGYHFGQWLYIASH